MTLLLLYVEAGETDMKVYGDIEFFLRIRSRLLRPGNEKKMSQLNI